MVFLQFAVNVFRYLDVHREDLFLPSAYEDAVKFIDQSPQDCIKEVPTESDIQRWNWPEEHWFVQNLFVEVSLRQALRELLLGSLQIVGFY